MEREHDEAGEKKVGSSQEAKYRLVSLVGEGNLEELQTLVNSMNVENGDRAELINSPIVQEQTILHIAAARRDISLIEWILSDSGGRAAGFNKLLAKDSVGRTALHSAAGRGSLELFLAIVEGLKVENGERVEMFNAVDDDGRTVLHRAVHFGSDEIVDWLLSEKGREAGFNRDNLFALNNNNQSVLHLAVNSRQSVDCFDKLLDHCGNAEERSRLLFGVDNRGWTVLHWALHRDMISVIEWVVSRQQEERGGSNEDLFALTNDKQSVLHVVARGGSAENFDLLLSHCCSTSERLRLLLGRDDKGWTIFHHAARHSEGKMITHILRKYPEESKMIIDARDSRGMTVLHLVIIGGIDKESCEEWGYWLNDTTKGPIVAALLGFENVNKEDRIIHPERDAAAMTDDDGEGAKKPINDKKVAIATAAGADPNVGLKFE